MKKIHQKLTLSRETVRRLGAPKSAGEARKENANYPTTTVLTRIKTVCTCL